jgi:hypothetical protein
MTMSEVLELPSVSATVTMRLAARDRTVWEFSWQDGEVTTTHYDAEGNVCGRRAVFVCPNGDVHVDETTAPAKAPCPAGAAAAHGPSGEAPGLDVAPADLAGAVRVDKTYDRDGRLATVQLSGPWGAECLTLHPDGSSSCDWRLNGLRGHQAWDAGRRVTDDEIVIEDQRSRSMAPLAALRPAQPDACRPG